MAGLDPIGAKIRLLAGFLERYVDGLAL